jgi:hypothetical protein
MKHSFSDCTGDVVGVDMSKKYVVRCSYIYVLLVHNLLTYHPHPNVNSRPPPPPEEKEEKEVKIF